VWEAKYRLADAGAEEHTISQTWERVATALAAVETDPTAARSWAESFFSILTDFKFLPGGRIQAGAGTKRNVTLFNCFVMGTIEDSIPGIFGALQEGAVTMQWGGGIGCDFSTLRPRGTQARGAGSIASGPVSFMRIWDAMCATILSTGARRGAMMATLRCDHPDIEEFIAAKQRFDQLRHFNLSVLVTDAFMAAVRANADWLLVFPAAALQFAGPTLMRTWSGETRPVPCCVMRSVRARDLWDRILRATYEYAEPGVLFVDRINQLNNLSYCEQISATNPCGEVPLPPYGACNLGSLNLTQFIRYPFSPNSHFDRDALARAATIAVRLLDDVIDASRFPLPQQAASARNTRRVGLGITGLADALVMLGMRYGSDESLATAADTMRAICHVAYRTSAAIAQEKGAFPYFDKEKYLQSPFVRSLPDGIQTTIARHGIRNSHLIAIAPTGTISLLAGNVSSGLEPIFATTYTRSVLAHDGTPKAFTLTSYALDLWRKRQGAWSGTPPAFVTSSDLPIQAHLDMQAALQPFVDNSISKTINVPDACSFAEFQRIYDLAYDRGLKGCTTFRPNPVTGTVLTQRVDAADVPHCCVPEREAD
jgi:ribonucleoside-diphosphate reductase alpha chain